VFVQVKALQDLATAEAAVAAAVAEFEIVAKRNSEDMEAFAGLKIACILGLMLRWVESMHVCSEAEADAWLRAAQAMGCNESHCSAIEAL
jgi:hypothetical protein